ncbi:MAG: redox-regulated ATPase YchF [Thermodesulfobacteria bacterium]|nr:redox-regulated ATPase YchF [Thermodesulfobacteriota bacterium]
MRLGIIGLPQSGKSTVFRAAAGNSASNEEKTGAFRRAVVKVPDERLSVLQKIFSSPKITPAQVEYLDLAFDLREREGRHQDLDRLLNELKPAAALLLVVRNFELAGLPPEPQKELDTLHEEMILSDLAIVERRIERLEKEVKKGKQPKEGELEALYRAKALLEEGRPLREDQDLRNNPLLRGYAFLSIKPLLVVINSGEEEEIPELKLPPATEAVAIRGRLEADLVELPPEEARIFREEYGLREPALPLLIRKSFEILDLICFFTGGEKETRAWPIPRGTTAQKAAGTIHSDMERGFIRAEVIGYDELVELGSYQAAQKAGKVRLEGKDYLVQDGDVIIFRFSV